MTSKVIFKGVTITGWKDVEKTFEIKEISDEGKVITTTCGHKWENNPWDTDHLMRVLRSPTGRRIMHEANVDFV